VKKEFTVAPDGPFSLEAAASFGFGPNTGRPQPEGALMRLAFVADDQIHQAGAVVRQDDDGTLTVTVEGPAGLDAEAVLHQVTRVLSVNVSVDEWLAAGQRDPVLGRIQAEHAGLRPVLFHSPYEAAAWSVLSARRHRSQGVALRQRLAEAHGRKFELAGEAVWALPAPAELLAVTELPGAEPARIDRLHGVARAALDGQLDPARLLSLEPGEALQ
jgi:DNA-3-methyladenine glycosylase II